MEKKPLTWMNFPLPVLVFLSFCLLSLASAEKKTYVVFMGKSQKPASFDDHAEWYDSSLKSVSESAEMLYKYNNVAHGFSARLTTDEAKSMENQPGEAVSELVIGVLDTGVWPESKSFHDDGMGSVPKSWRGECEPGTNFSSSNCNRKLIGARYFYKGYEAATGPINVSRESKSARDDDGHGTHTSSTAAGSSVKHASLYGYASGTARGMASRARVAMYKVCWLLGCVSSDILAGMDQAIEDNVNVLSLSLGGATTDYFMDSIAIGAFGAMEKGIFVSCSAGNFGSRSVYCLQLCTVDYHRRCRYLGP
ncbi:hypothetical protein Vadar_020450 [Vaccinium darrowii]|uniref:Uncharacterized protein n=1 Tax=Vaccinium darrowii TaxID=229202 RepID=A0ACB7YGX8_9ERIC|nr:hypothetical protein Vadar_020450 [Vaccinium darrowii]